MADPNITAGMHVAAALKTMNMDIDDYLAYVRHKQKQLEYERGRTFTEAEIAQGTETRAAQIEAQLEAEGLGDLGLDKYYQENLEYGGNEADLQSREAADFANSYDAPDPSYRESDKQRERQQKANEAIRTAVAEGRGGVSRSVDEGQSKLRRRQQGYIADTAYERRARKEGESQEGIKRRQQAEAAVDSLRYRMAKGPVVFPDPAKQSATQRLSALVNSGTLSPEDQQNAEAALRRLRISSDPAYAAAADFDAGVAAVRKSREPYTQQERKAIADRIVDMRLNDPDAEGTTPATGARLKTMETPTGSQTVPMVRYKRHSTGPAPDRAELTAAILASLPERGFNPSVQVSNQAAALNPVGQYIAATTDDRLGEITIRRGTPGSKDFIGVMPATFTAQNDPLNFPAAVAVETQQGTQYYEDRPMLSRQGNVNVTLGNPLGSQAVRTAAQMEQYGASTANTPDTSQNLNAPQGGTKLIDVLEQNQYANRQSGTYPQVDITQALSELDKRLLAQGIQVEGGVRSFNSAQAALDAVLEGGGKFNAPNSRDIVDNPGAAEALERMRYTQPEVGRLANALIQLEAGNRSSVNLDRKEAYRLGIEYPYEAAFQGNDPTDPLYRRQRPMFVGGELVSPGLGSVEDRNAALPSNRGVQFGAREAMGDFNAGVELEGNNSRLAPAFRALTGENIEGTPQEKKAALADARRNYQGLVKGEEPVGIEGKRSEPNYRFNRAGTYVNQKPKYGKDGEKYKGRMQRVGQTETSPEGIASALRTQAAARAGKKGQTAEQRQRTEQNILNAQKVQARFDASANASPTRAETPLSAEIAKRKGISDHLSRSKPAVPASVKMRAGKGEDAGPRELTGVSQLVDNNPEKPSPRMEATSSYQAGSWMGGDNQGRVVSPWAKESPAPASVSKPPSPQITDPFTTPPATGPGFTRGPVPVQGPMAQPTFAKRAADAGRAIARRNVGGAEGARAYMTEPDFSVSESTNRGGVRAFQNYQKMRRYGRNAAITGGAGAAVAGLDALIGGERERREEEAIR